MSHPASSMLSMPRSAKYVKRTLRGACDAKRSCYSRNRWTCLVGGGQMSQDNGVKGKDDHVSSQQSLGEYLDHLRASKRMTLRDVEEATGHEVSNAYLSQL